MVGRYPRDWSRRFAAGLGLDGIDEQRIEIGLESVVVAASWFLVGRGVPVDFWHNGSSVLDKY